MTIRFRGAALLAALLPGLFASAAHAVPNSFSTTGSAVQTYFAGHPTVSASSRFGGWSGTLDLARDTPVLATYFEMYAGTGPADPGGSGIEYKSHQISMTVAGITETFTIDIGMQEIANDQYQLYGFDLPVLTFDLGGTGVLTVTPDTRFTQSVQFLANTPLYPFREIRANFELSDPRVSPVREPGTLALATLAVGALSVTRRRGTVRRRS